ncbi:MAG: transaldolase family protein, partial [Elusimicrobia bacterium]|nr:transaldolase family protein [Elusimicrobiota bacterium]
MNPPTNKTFPGLPLPLDGGGHGGGEKRTPLQQTQDLGVDFWNDSCDLQELGEAVKQGAVGATSNPVIVGAALEKDQETWRPILKKIIQDNPSSDADEIARELIEQVAAKAAFLLFPVYERTKGEKGYLSVQISPKLYEDPPSMLEQGKKLSRLAKNIAVKVPAIETGLTVIENLVADGIPVNATVSFTVSQAVACAEAMEKGMRARKNSPCYVTLMVGRLDDHLKRIREKEKISVEPEYLDWAGIAVFKKAAQLFKQRKYKAKLLVAAYRHQKHWSELIGEGIVQSIPYSWWTQFNQSQSMVSKTLDKPVDDKIVNSLYKNFEDFRKAYDENGMKPDEFSQYGASLHTLDQFV